MKTKQTINYKNKKQKQTKNKNKTKQKKTKKQKQKTPKKIQKQEYNKVRKKLKQLKSNFEAKKNNNNDTIHMQYFNSIILQLNNIRTYLCETWLQCLQVGTQLD